MRRMMIGAGIIMVIVAAGTLVACLVLAGNAAAQFETGVQRAARGLEADFTALSDTTYRGLVDDPDQPAEQSRREIDTVRQVIARTRQHLADLGSASRTIKTVPLTEVSVQYRNAQVLQDKTQATIRQANETLTDYETLIASIEAYLNARGALQAEFSHLNGTSDFNDFAGQGEVFRAAAARLRAARDAYDKTPTPAAMEELHKHTNSLFERTASAFDDLGYGYDVAVDDLIYGPIHRLETLTAEFDAQNQQLYIPALRDARVIRDVRDLSEKLDPLMEPLL